MRLGGCCTLLLDNLSRNFDDEIRRGKRCVPETGFKGGVVDSNAGCFGAPHFLCGLLDAPRNQGYCIQIFHWRLSTMFRYLLLLLFCLLPLLAHAAETRGLRLSRMA